MARRTRPILERLFAKVEITATCWLWAGSRCRSGYGQIRRGRRGRGLALVHRVVYEATVGPIPEGFELDHLCRVTNCVNPEHLEPVTHRVNILRGRSPSVLAHTSGVCEKGHPFAEYGVRRRDGKVYCRLCRNAYNARYYARRRGATE